MRRITQKKLDTLSPERSQTLFMKKKTMISTVNQRKSTNLQVPELGMLKTKHIQQLIDLFPIRKFPKLRKPEDRFTQSFDLVRKEVEEDYFYIEDYINNRSKKSCCCTRCYNKKPVWLPKYVYNLVMKFDLI